MALLANYPMQDDAMSTIVSATVGANATLLGGGTTAAKTVAGPGGLYPKALRMNGTTDAIQTPTIVFDSRVVSVSFWALLPGLGNIVLESSTNADSGTEANPRFYIIGENENLVEQLVIKGSSYQLQSYDISLTRPTSYNVWKHYVAIFDMTQPTANAAQCTLFINRKVVQRTTPTLTGSTSTNNFQSNPIFVGARNGTSLRRVVSMAGLKIFNHRLSQAEIDLLWAENQPPSASGQSKFISSFFGG